MEFLILIVLIGADPRGDARGKGSRSWWWIYGSLLFIVAFRTRS